MGGGAGSILMSEHLCVTSQNTDPRGVALLRSAHDLGITALTGIDISDLVFFRGGIHDDTKQIIESLLVDSLLQHGEWNLASTQHQHLVETALHPGVTDSTTDELQRVIRRMDLPIDGVASGKRFALHGSLSPSELDRLISALLANPIIERWSVDLPIEPLFVDTQAIATIAVHRVPIDATTTPEQLAVINKERGLALDPEELIAIRDHFSQRGVHPTDVELETIAQTWSEHCAHKTFRANITTESGSPRPSLINQLRASTDTINAPYVVSSFVGNAGIISFTPGRTLALKCETHNHPSAIEPFGGANTGVGGVIRDIMGAQHTPIACTNILCFGPPDTDTLSLPEGVFPPLRTRDGVIDGIADYGNKIGLPTVAGAVLYDPGYTANPLVYAGCIGTSSSFVDQVAPQPRDRIVVLGGRTGRDGLRGATFSSMTMDATTGDVSGASVQIGDPITEKLVIDVLVDAQHLYRAITDCGAGGLSSAIGEMAEGVGARVELTHAPLKYPGLAPWEIWLSEAQERMVLAVAPQQCDELQLLCTQHGVEYTDMGEFTGDNQLVVTYNNEPVLQLDTNFLHNGRPQRNMRAIMPKPNRTADQSAPKWLTQHNAADVLMALLGHPNIASKASVIHRYDHEIRGATAVRPLVGQVGDGHGDGVVIAEPLDDFGFSIGIGVNPWFGIHDAERMALACIDEAMRNVVAVGADPDKAVLLDNFSWGDPRRETTLGELAAAVDGCVAGAHAFAAPFVSGKDSLNNEYLGSDGERHSVPPTLVITAVAHVPNANRTVTADLKTAGNKLILVGRTLPEFGGSHAAMVCNAQSTCVPTFDEQSPTNYRAVHALMLQQKIRACHDCSEGGLAVTVAEMAMAGRLGAALLTATDIHTHLFSESLGRLVLEVEAAHVSDVLAALPGAQIIGSVTTTPFLVLPDNSALSIEAMLNVWQAPQ